MNQELEKGMCQWDRQTDSVSTRERETETETERKIKNDSNSDG